MNTIREINRINERELELGLGVKGSWHDEFKDSAYIYVGGLSYELTEGDVITVFSQWGEIADVNLPRDKETGKTKGFGFVMYEDQKSTVLAVDNMNGAQVVGRTIRVDHCRNYKQPGSKNEDGEWEAPEAPVYNALVPTLEASGSESDSESSVHESLDEEDPMAAFIRAEKKKAKKAKALTDGKKGKRRREGESKEERRKRKEAKRAKKKVKSEQGSRDMDRERGDRERGKSRDREEKREKGRSDRDDWRDGKFELERDEREKSRNRDDRIRGDYRDRKDEEERSSSRNDESIREGRNYSRDERYGHGSSRRGEDRYRSREQDTRNRINASGSGKDDYRDRDRDRDRSRDEYDYRRREERDRR